MTATLLGRNTRTPRVESGSTVVAAGGFPSASMVASAAGLFHGHRVEDRRLGVTLLGGIGPGKAAPAPVDDGGLWALESPAVPVYDPRGDLRRDRLRAEGPIWRVLVSPGSVAIRYTDPVRADRTHERMLASAEAATAQAVRRLLEDPTADPFPAGGERRCITSWSAKSRARMVATLHALDWSKLTDEGRLALVTLTYPGDWLAVAPHADAARRHLLMLRKRFCRAWGRETFRAVWKREFQDRGAPHWHLLMAPPEGVVSPFGPLPRGVERDNRDFRTWLAEEWASIVGSESCGAALGLVDDSGRIVCCERHRHRAAGVAVDYSKGRRATSPALIASYFSKHGLFRAKDYQNLAPAEWVEAGSVGRFWGVWGLSPAVAGVHLHPAEAVAALRTMRRYSRANAPVVKVDAWRYRTRADGTAKWRKVQKRRRLYRRLSGKSGFLVTQDGPSLAADLARHLDRLRRPEQIIGRSGAGPVGFLP